MEQRNADFYRKQPSIIKYSLKTRDPKSPEASAVILAIVDRKNVTLAPDIDVRICGQVGIPSPSNPDIKCCDWIITSPIRSIYFEKVHERDGVSFHCYVRTENSVYRLHDSDGARLAGVNFLLEDLDERKLEFKDFKEFYTDVNMNYTEVEVVL